MKDTATPAKKAPATKKPPVLRFQGASLQLGRDKLAELLFIAFTSKQLGEHLRQRGLKIPQDKRVAAHRLAEWATQSTGRFDLHLTP